MEKIIKFLEEYRGNWMSGEQMAGACGISRAAVWKHIGKLRAKGYQIESVPNKGYRLCQTSDILSLSSIQQHVHSNFVDKIFLYEEVTSTNDEAKHLAALGVQEGSIIISESQTGGKGRQGRSFSSPKNNGIYLSVILRPTHPIASGLLLTAMSAVAVMEAIREICDIQADIKWVNDIMIKGKKVCGILAEAALEVDAARFEYIVIGIGINCYYGSLPSELENIATTLSEHTKEPFQRSALIGELLNRFFHHYKQLEYRYYMEDYRRYSCILHKPLQIMQAEQVFYGTAVEIDDDANLIVLSEGERRQLFTGEVTTVREQKHEKQ